MKRVLLPLTVGLAVFATPSPSARQDETDNWKTALGWNGTYTPPEKVGDNMTDGLVSLPFNRNDLPGLEQRAECTFCTIEPGPTLWRSLFLSRHRMARQLRILGPSML